MTIDEVFHLCCTFERRINGSVMDSLTCVVLDYDTLNRPSHLKRVRCLRSTRFQQQTITDKAIPNSNLCRFCAILPVNGRNL